MGLFRLILLTAIILAAVWLWRRMTRPKPPANNPQDNPELMVRCAHCGIHTPQASALRQADHWYCSQPHLEQGPSTGER